MIERFIFSKFYWPVVVVLIILRIFVGVYTSVKNDNKMVKQITYNVVTATEKTKKAQAPILNGNVSVYEYSVLVR